MQAQAQQAARSKSKGGADSIDSVASALGWRGPIPGDQRPVRAAQDSL